MPPSTCSVEQFDAHIRSLARGDERSVILLDGYTGAGKTSFATRLAQIPGVAWTPIYLFETDDGLDTRKMKKDLLKPFRKEGRVRELVPAMSGSGLQRGRPQSGIKVLVIEGPGVAASSKAIKSDEVCWLECHRDRRIDRLLAANSAADRDAMDATFDHEESVDMRSAALQVANFVVDMNSADTDEAPADRIASKTASAPTASTSALLVEDSASFAARIGVDPSMITAELDTPLNGSAHRSEPEVDLLPGWLGDH